MARELKIGEKVWKLTDDGFCAYCDAYRAMWLSDCDNPIHKMPREETDLLTALKGRAR